MKKIGAITLCVFLLMSALSVGMTASAEEVMLQFVVNGDGTAQIGGYTGEPVAIGIPGQAGEWTVTGINDAAFEGCATLKRVVLPDTMDSVGVRAFADCGQLADITLPASVKKIGADAFAGTAYAKDPANWTDDVLYLDHALLTVHEAAGDRVVIKDGTTTVAQRAFINLPDLKAVIVPASVTFIDEFALDGCENAGLYMPINATYAIEYAKTNGIPYGIIADLVKDGHVDMLDALILYNMVSNGSLEASMYYTADYNCNGLVDMMDCLQLYTAIS